MLTALLTMLGVVAVVIVGLYLWDRAEPNPEAREDQFPVER